MQTKEAALTPKPQKQYKDRLFRLLFSERSDLLELYNALYGDEERYFLPSGRKNGVI